MSENGEGYNPVESYKETNPARTLRELRNSASGLGFSEKPKSKDANTVEKLFDNRSSKVIQDDDGRIVQVHLQTNNNLEKGVKLKIDGQEVKVVARVWVISKATEDGKGYSSCYSMDSDGKWYLQTSDSYERQGDNVNVWQRHEVTRIGEDDVRSGVFARLPRIPERIENTVFTRDRGKNRVTDVEKVRPFTNPNYIPRGVGGGGGPEEETPQLTPDSLLINRLGLTEMPVYRNIQRQPGERDEAYDRRYQRMTLDRGMIELQVAERPDKPKEEIVFDMNGSTIKDRILMKLWFIAKPRARVQNAECYMLTEKHGWVAQYGERDEPVGHDTATIQRITDTRYEARANTDPRLPEDRRWRLRGTLAITKDKIDQRFRMLRPKAA